MALFLVKIKEDVWINPDKITSIFYGKGPGTYYDEVTDTYVVYKLSRLTIYLLDGNDYSFYDKDADELVTLLHDKEIFFK